MYTLDPHQEASRQELYSLLGDLPDRRRAIRSELVWREDREKYTVEKLTLDLNGHQPVPAFLVLPRDVAVRKAPAVLYNHFHGGKYQQGKDELILGDAKYLQSPPYAELLAARGRVTLCIDHWLFGERSGRSESSLFKEMLWKGQVLWGMMLYDSIRALDYLTTRSEVDAQRVATIGLSMGSTMGWWLAALDPRVKVTIDLCCLTDFHALIDSGGLDGHGIYYYVPRLLKHFTTAQITALIAPRPHLSLAGNLDRLTPPAGLDRIDEAMKKEYAARGAADAWKLHREDVGHQETPAMRAEIERFLDRWL
jgi:pimeloyl-ACP methyl ester carboxylesterase